MNTKQKLIRILGITGWSKDHLADLLGIGNLTILRWIKGRAAPKDEHLAKINSIYTAIVVPLECQIDQLSDAVEKQILTAQIKDLKNDDCPVDRA